MEWEKKKVIVILGSNDFSRIRSLFGYNANMKRGYVYIMANDRPTLYAGVTSNLINRVYQHKNNLVKGFTSKYNLHKLVYYEIFDDIMQSIIREKQIKDMNRNDKINMIKKLNPELEDLYHKILG